MARRQKDRNAGDKRSPVVARATTVGYAVAILVMLVTYLFAFGWWRTLSLEGIWERNIEGALDPWMYFFNPLLISCALGLLVGGLVASLLVLRSIRPNESISVALGPAIDEVPGGEGNTSSTTNEVLSDFIGEFDLSSDHSLFLPFRTGRNPGIIGDRKGHKVAISTHRTVPAVLAGEVDERGQGSVLDAGLAIESEDGRLRPTPRILQAVLQNLINRHGVSGVVGARLAIDTGARLQPNPRLLYNAPVFIHYGRAGTPTGLSHSLSPITGSEMANQLWDVSTVYEAGKDSGILHLTSSIHHAAILRSEGLHAVAIHPQIWAHTELLSAWPLPPGIFRPIDYCWPAQPKQTAERFAQWLSKLVVDAGVSKILYDLSLHFPPIMGHETIVHRAAPRLAFRRFVADFVTPRLKGTSMHVVHPGPLLTDYIRRTHAAHDPRNVFTVSRMLPDLYGEDVLLGMAGVPEELRGIKLERPQTDDTGTDTVLDQDDKQTEPPRYEFTRLSSGRWRIVFEAEEDEFGDLNGLRMFAALVSHPSSRIDAKQLHDQFAGNGGPGEWVPIEAPDKLKPIGASLEDIAGSSLDGSATRHRTSRISHRLSHQPKLTLSQVDHQIHELQEELALLEDSPEPEADARATVVEARLNELAQRRSLLADVVDDHGPYEERVGKNFRDACEQLEEKGMPRLVSHLSAAMGAFETSTLIYDPVGHGQPLFEWAVRWDT